MQCEICGSDIRGKPHTVNVEGSVLEVCDRCARYGKPADKWAPVSKKLFPVERSVRTVKAGRSNIFDKLREEIIPDFDVVIKDVREKRNLTVEELASRIKEKAALLRKIERREITPEDELRRKLEKELEIKLTERVGTEQKAHALQKGITLGDIANIRRK